MREALGELVAEVDQTIMGILSVEEFDLDEYVSDDDVVAMKQAIAKRVADWSAGALITASAHLSSRAVAIDLAGSAFVERYLPKVRMPFGSEHAERRGRLVKVVLDCYWAALEAVSTRAGELVERQ